MMCRPHFVARPMLFAARRHWHHTTLRFLLLCLALGSVPASASGDERTRLQQQIEQHLRAQSASLPGEPEAKFHLPAALPACAQFMITSPPAARAIGRSSVLIRCAGNAAWSLLLPVQIQLVADYLVSARNIAAGQPLGTDDLSSRRGDLGLLPAGTLIDPEQALGQLARVGIAAGQPLRQDLLRAQEIVKAGQTVSVNAGGEGFSVRNSGMALNGGGPGALIRVRLPNGQVVSGQASAPGEVRLGS